MNLLKTIFGSVPEIGIVTFFIFCGWMAVGYCAIRHDIQEEIRRENVKDLKKRTLAIQKDERRYR